MTPKEETLNIERQCETIRNVRKEIEEGVPVEKTADEQLVKELRQIEENVANRLLTEEDAWEEVKEALKRRDLRD